MPINFYPRTLLTGGVAGSLDNLDGADLADLDIAMVGISASDAKFYVLDDDSGAAECSPDIIAPDTNAGPKRWILLNAHASELNFTGDASKVSAIAGGLQVTDGAEIGEMYFNGSILILKNYKHAGYFAIYVENTSGTNRVVLNANSNGSVDIYNCGSGAIEGQAQNGYWNAANGLKINSSQTITGMSGADLTLISGTAGDNLDFASWNADGDIVGSGLAPSEIGVLATANEWTKPQNVDETALTSTSNAVAWDAALVQCGLHTLTENTTIGAPSNLKAGSTYILRVVQAAGVYTLAFNAVFKWGTADTPVAPAANGDVVIFSFYSDGTNMYGVDAVREEA